MQTHKKKSLLPAILCSIGISIFAAPALAQNACPAEHDVWIKKSLTGGPTSFAATSFPFTMSCSGTPAAVGGFSLTGSSPEAVIPRRTVGATCTVTETRPAAPAGYAWTTPTSISFVVLPCSPGAPSQSPMIVTFPNTLVTAEVITEPAQGVPLLPLGGLAALALLLACFGASRVRKSR